MRILHMKRANFVLVLVIVLQLLISGCTTYQGALNLINPLRFVQTGFYPLLIITEIEVGFSSLLIDKTKAKVQSVSINPYEILPEDSTIYIMPSSITVSRKKTYDEYYSNMIKSYFMINNYAIPVTDIESADYILRTDITESFESLRGTNSSVLQITIMEQNEQPVFFSTVVVVSKSDKNFYYYPSKAAKPVKELTILALEETFQQAIPAAFGEYQEG